MTESAEKMHMPALFKKFTLPDMLFFIAAFLSLIYAELTFFNGNANQAIFVGLWVPSILSFGIYLKMIKS